MTTLSLTCGDFSGDSVMPTFGRKLSAPERLRRQFARSGRLIIADQNLEGIELGRRALLGVVFRRCELAFADFSGADLSLAQFEDCNLYRADFTGAVLYTTRFYECNLTRADFSGSYLLGFRLRNVDLTKAAFDRTPAVGLERKLREDPIPRILRVPLLAVLPTSAPAVEENHRGIRMSGHDRTVAFLRDGDSDVRRRLRLAETAKYLKIAHAENGYERQAQHYYVMERRQRRKALEGSALRRLQRAQDLIFGDLVWRYGSSVVRPVSALGVVALAASALTFVAPLAGGDTGLLAEPSGVLYRPVGWTGQSLVNYLNIVYYFLTSPAGGSQDDLTGWVKVVFVIYLLTALWLIALTFEASTKRLGSTL